jgi:UDPglucose 6-dehydrogenase
MTSEPRAGTVTSEGSARRSPGTSDRTVAMVGAGYVGLTTGACLAHLGHRVVVVDVDKGRIEGLRAGQMPIFEEGLAELVAEGVEAGRLSFTLDAANAVAGAEFVFLCVPTPRGADGSADLRHVRDAARHVGPHLRPDAVVVTKSTVPVGSAAAVAGALGRPEVAVVSNPEFLREGRAIHDCLHPDRVVVGALDRAIAERVAGLYASLDAPVVITDPASSETIKYAANAFLAMKVSFINSVANLCQRVGADIGDVIEGMSYDRRIGADHLTPGPGWGGSCFPKDTSALIRLAEDHGYDFALLRQVVAVNEEQFEYVAERAAEAAGGVMAGARIAVWGLTFKAGTDDLRDSPAIAVIRRLRARGALVVAYDPTQPDPSDPVLAGLGLELTEDPYSACQDARCLLLLTEWAEFAAADLVKAAAGMASPTLIDGRNLLDPAAARAAGFRYEGIGRT